MLPLWCRSAKTNIYLLDRTLKNTLPLRPGCTRSTPAIILPVVAKIKHHGICRKRRLTLARWRTNIHTPVGQQRPLRENTRSLTLVGHSFLEHRQRCIYKKQKCLDRGGVDEELGRSPCRFREFIPVASKETVGNELNLNSPVRHNWIRRGYGRFKYTNTRQDLEHQYRERQDTVHITRECPLHKCNGDILRVNEICEWLQIILMTHADPLNLRIT